MQQFFFVAWTTLNMENENGREWPTNILAVGGLYIIYFVVTLETSSFLPKMAKQHLINV